MINKSFEIIKKLMLEFAKGTVTNNLEDNIKQAAPARAGGSQMILPLAISGYGDFNAKLRKKLFLIRKFNLADVEKLLNLLKSKSDKKKLTLENKNWLDELWENAKCNVIIFFSKYSLRLDPVMQ
jgi:hypothetical protein